MKKPKACHREEKREIDQIIEEALSRVNSIDCTKIDSPLLTFCNLNKIVEDTVVYLERVNQGGDNK